MEIVNGKYLLASLINDTVNIIRMRLKEKPIRFYTNIDGNIPNCLIGDEARLRQILLNLLSNAAKFTDRGFVSLTITVKSRDKDIVLVEFKIADSGKGIRSEDKEKLFSEFVQVDLKRNRNVEGTGLGLTITKRLCSIMNGSINMESEYGVGSTFTVTIPQGLDLSENNTAEPFAAVDDAENKKVLIYEGRTVYAKSVCWSLKNLGVPHLMVTNINDFSEALFKEKWSFVLSGYGIHEKIKELMSKPNASYPGGKKPLLALMVEWGTEAYIPGVRFVSLPVQSLSIANILNGKEDSKGYSELSCISGIIRYSFPSARMLVVDDISTNLKVAEGLLAPYRAAVDTCLSGADAVEFVKHYDYDIVFMDHMMPDMDGIEATTIIREWEKDKMVSNSEIKKIPIVALTANAVSGVREMFIEKGFNDFIAKPIDVSALDDVINRWLPKKKREHGAGKIDTGKNRTLFPSIEGIDIQRGIAMTGGTETGFIAVLSTFCRDAKERLKLIQKAHDENDTSLFVTHVHGLKSAAASIGATDIASQASMLEKAGREENEALINANISNFYESLAKLIDGIGNALEIEKAEHSSAKIKNNSTELIPLLKRLEEALNTQKADNIDSLLDNINRLPMDETTKEAIDKISDDILMTEFNKAIKTIKQIMTKRKK
jgi:CheY-like chemotaxis protein